MNLGFKNSSEVVGQDHSPNMDRILDQCSNFRVLIISTVTDRLNTNSVIRDYVSEGFQAIFGYNRILSCPIEIAIATISWFRPSLIVAVGSVIPDSSPLRHIRKAADGVNAVLALWQLDDPYEFDYSFKSEIGFDFLFSNDWWAVQHYSHRSVHHLPLAASPKYHFRELKDITKRSIEIFFCGVAYPNRIAILESADKLLASHSVAILGSDWPQSLRCATNQRLSRTEMADQAQDACFTLNLGRDRSIANQRYQLPQMTPGPRTFEVALSGSTQLYFVTGLEIADYFELNTEIIPFDSVRDIKDALDRLNDEPEVIFNIAKKAQSKALAKHTYKNRAEHILEICGVSL